MAEQKKVFVLDTNVILHDHNCIHMFGKHDVVIPTIILEELDRFKKGSEELNYNARKFIHAMDEFRQHRTKVSTPNKSKNVLVSALLNGGVTIAPGQGNIQVRVSKKPSQAIIEAFPEDSADHRILSTVREMQRDNKELRKVILVTKDVNLRVKADVLGIEVEDYENDKVSATDMYLGRTTLADCPDEFIQGLYKGLTNMDTFKKLFKYDFYPNMYFVLKSPQSSILVCFDSIKQTLVRTEKHTISGIVPRNSEQVFVADALVNPKMRLVSLAGNAGTGKTLLAMAAGLEQLKKGLYDQIIVASAIVPLSNRDIGALPGDINEKVSPYMQGIFDNLAFIKNQMGKKDAKWVEDMTDEQKKGRIQIQPLVAIRGRSFNNTYFVVDEAQNLTPHEVKTIVTRAGENTKVVFCGDTSQIDSPYLDAHSNGLSHLIAKMKGQALFAHITLEKGERSELAEIAANIL